MNKLQPDIPTLVQASSLIFAGTVVKLGASSVANLPPRDNFAVVRVDRSFQSDPALGRLSDRLITVALVERGELQLRQQAVFFAMDWIHGGGIAARELAHVDTRLEDEIDSNIEKLPERHLAERLNTSVLVFAAHVRAIKPTPFDVR